MGIQPVKRVLYTANERLDLVDVVADQTSMMNRVGAAILGAYAGAVDAAVGQKGLVFTGFAVSGVAPSASQGAVQITGDGFAVDANGNLLFKQAAVGYQSAFGALLNSTVYYAHIFFQEAAQTNAARRFWNASANNGLGAETSTSVNTENLSTFGVYFSTSPVDVDGASHPTIAIAKFQFDGSGNFTLLEDFRPRPRAAGPVLMATGSDRQAFFLCQNIAALTYTRGVTDSYADTLTATLTNPTYPGYIKLIDNNYRPAAAAAGLGEEEWHVPAGAGTVTAVRRFLKGFDSTGVVSIFTRSGAALLVGTTDAFSLQFVTNGASVWSINSGGTLLGDSNHYISGVKDPSLAQDVATKNYVDTAVGSSSLYGTAHTWTALQTFTAAIAVNDIENGSGALAIGTNGTTQVTLGSAAKPARLPTPSGSPPSSGTELSGQNVAKGWCAIKIFQNATAGSLGRSTFTNDYNLNPTFSGTAMNINFIYRNMTVGDFSYAILITSNDQGLARPGVGAITHFTTANQATTGFSVYEWNIPTSNSNSPRETNWDTDTNFQSQLSILVFGPT